MPMSTSDKVIQISNRIHYNKEKLVNLNLHNFESEEASNCSYILTSPRSLKACNLANIKPIELLYRSASDIAKDLDASAYEIDPIYADYEQERLRKLEVCKLIRKHLLLSSEVNESIPKITNSSPNIFSNRESTSRLSIYTREDTPDYSHFLRENKSRSPFSIPGTPALRYNPLRKTKSCRSLCYSVSSSSSSSISSLTINLNNKHRQRSKSEEKNKYKTNIKKIIKRNISNSKRILEKHNPKKIKSDLGKRYQMSEAERMNDQQLCWRIDNVKSSSQLENQKNKTNAIPSKQSFEVKKLKNKESIMEQNNFVTNCEKVISDKTGIRKLQKTKRNSKLSQDFTSDNDNHHLKRKTLHNTKKKNDKCNENIKTREKNINAKQCDNCDEMEGLKNHDVRILDAMAMKQELRHSQENLAQKARVVWALTPSEESHPSTKSMDEKRPIIRIQKLDNLVESPTFESYFNHIRNKMKQFKEDSLHKELHGEQVRQLARELQVGMEQWQDQVLLLQWHALQKARTNAKLHIENKRLKTQCENNERALLHALRLKNIQDMERIKQSSMKKEIEQKDCKIEKLKMKREREILDCRAQAHYTAELREQLRRTLTPQTFDQKVNDVIVKTRFINRSLTASPFTESHIRLG